MPKYAQGTIIDARYEVLEYLGSGSSGEVYRVLDTYQNFVGALKLLDPQRVSKGPWHEAQVLTQLKSDFILPVRNADTFAGLPYLVTELAMNGTAADAMTPIGVEPARAIRWICSACHGTARAHDAGLVHRDIKPGNLFLTGDDEALLGDFGMAMFMASDGTADRDGTPVTVAPEVAAGGRTSVLSDVYSLGAALYALLAGEYCHQGKTNAHVFAALRAGPGIPLRDVAPHVSQGHAASIAKAMARKPSDRYKDPIAFAGALSDVAPPRRRWWRTDEHDGHLRCWRGLAEGKAEAFLCCLESGTKVRLEARYESGRRISEGCRPPVSVRDMPRRVRSAIRSIS